jgi:hypothetical protein
MRSNFRADRSLLCALRLPAVIAIKTTLKKMPQFSLISILAHASETLPDVDVVEPGTRFLGSGFVFVVPVLQ